MTESRRFTPLTNPSDSAALTEHRFISFDETPIFFSWQSARSAKKAVALILHGMGEHGGRYRPLSDYLSERGIETYRPDLRGYGRSGGSRGHVNRFSDFHRDLEALHRLAEKQNPGAPVFIFGHSFGGLVAASYLALGAMNRALTAPGTCGLILTSPLFGIFGKIPAWRHALAVIASVILPTYTEKTRVNPAYLTHDKQLIELYRKDALIHYDISTRLYTEFVRHLRSGDEIAKNLTLPLLVLQAGDDRIVRKEKTVEFYQQAASADKELQIYEGFYHEILNETGRERVFAKIGDWLGKHLPS